MYNEGMGSAQLVELPLFSRLVAELMTDLELWELQDALAASPDAGDLIPGGKGLRKIRWRLRSRGRGKRGGVRVIYYWRKTREVICFVTLYAKSAREDLTRGQLKALARLVKGQLP